jgi:hypothetical protein
VALAVTGCSRLELGYGFATWWLRGRVDSVTELDAEQSRLADAVVRDYLAWHRREMLPRYVTFLRGFAAAYEQRAAERDSFERLRVEVERLYRQTVAAAVPGMATIFATQTGGASDTLVARLAKDQQELTEDSARPLADRVDDGVEGVADIAEDLFGDLTDEQEALVRARLSRVLAAPQLWLDRRVERARALVAAVRRGDEERIAVALRAWWLGEGESPSPEYRRYADTFGVEMWELCFELLAHTSPSQRQELVGNLRGWADELAALATVPK